MNYYNEFDPNAAAWLRELISENLIPQGHVDTRSITEVSPSDLSGFNQCHFFAGIGGWPLALAIARCPDDRPVWTGSCPCQPLSCAGQQKGHADERHLWPAFYRLIAECRPPTVFGEQVASRDGREWLSGVRADLEGVGYAVGAADLCAAGVGAPHIRQRLYWVAHADGGLPGDRGVQPGGEHRQQPQDGGVGRLDDAPGARREEHDGGQLLPGTVERCEAGGVADAERLRRGCEAGSSDHREPETDRSADWAGGRSGAPVRLEHSPGDGREQRGAEPGGRGTASGCGSGFWSDSILLPCRDGKARRVEPTIFPLAHGVSGRVGLLRGAGNAIVPQLAATFIRAFMT